MLSIGIIKERKKNENRVSLVPKDILNLFKIGFKKVNVEKSAGLLSGYSDNNYIKYGSIIKNKNDIWNSSIIISINFPKLKYLFLLKKKSILICLDNNLNYISNLDILKKKKITLIILNYTPRISRLQTMDVLSSISYVSGYRSVIESIYEYKNFINNQVFISGSINPINVLVIGAGIFGLSAASLCKNIGTNIYVYDINKNVKDEVISLGAKFIDIGSNILSDYLFKKINKFDIIINSIIFKNKNLSLVWKKKILNNIKYGSVIVNLINFNINNDMFYKEKKILKINNIKIINCNDFSNLMPRSISKLYSNNMVNILSYIVDKEKNIYLNLKDIFLKNVLILYNGIENKKKKILIKKKIKVCIYKNNFYYLNLIYNFVNIFIFFLFYFILLYFLYQSYFLIYLNNLFIFLFSYFLGYTSINKIKDFLHTPLMSLTNSISSIVIIGCLLQINENNSLLNVFFSLVTLGLVNINIFSGFLITKRMLKIFFN